MKSLLCVFTSLVFIVVWSAGRLFDWQVMSSGTSVRAVSIHGWCAPGFAPLKQAFIENFLKRGEVHHIFNNGVQRWIQVGASISLYVRGKQVVHLWGGDAESASHRAGKVNQPWLENTLVNCYSCTKVNYCSLLLCIYPHVSRELLILLFVLLCLVVMLAMV